MPQRTIHRSLANLDRPATIGGLLPALATTLITLLATVLLITNGGAGSRA